MKMISKFLMFFVIVGVVVVIGLLALNRGNFKSIVLDKGGEEEVRPSFGGTIMYTEGDVQYRASDSSDVSQAKEGLHVYEGYSIDTLTDARAIINLDDGSVLRLNGDSSITLTSLDPNHLVIAHKSGELYSRVVEAERTFEVVAGAVTYESVGTAYKTISTEDQKGVEVYQSKVKVKEKGSDDVLVEEGEKYFVKNQDTGKEKAVLDVDKEDLKKDEFVLWNKLEDEKDFSGKLGILADVEGSGSNVKSISLTHLGVGKVSWEIDGEAKQGVKVVWSKEKGPEYPSRSSDRSKYISDTEQTTASMEAFDGDGRYYILVCEYLGDGCGVYSNEVQVDFYGTEQITETAPPATRITLSDLGGVKVSWTSNKDLENGVKLVWSKTASPTYPTRSTDQFKFIGSGSSASVDAFDGGGAYYVRVCEYLGNKACGAYSNEIQVALEGEKEQKEEPSEISSISLSSAGGGTVQWSVVGTGGKGFKLIWSKTEGPTYPTRATDMKQYYGDPNTTSGSVYAFDGDGTYYVRVCDNTSSGCGVYSNQITVELTK